MKKILFVFTLVLAIATITLPLAFPAWATGVYQEYSAESYENTKNLKRVLFFYANWCSGCRGTDQQLRSATIPDDVIVLKIDYDSSVELRKKYGVPYQGTFVQIDSTGEKISLWFGDANSLADHVQ